MNGPGGPAPDISVGRIHQHAGPSAPAPGEGAFTSPRSIQVTVQQPAESGAAAQPSGKGPGFPMTGPAPLLTTPPFLLSPPTPARKAPPQPCAPACCPREDPGQPFWAWERGGHLATPGGPALEMGSWLQDSSPLPPPAPHSPPFSPLLSLTASSTQKRSTGHLGAFATELGAGDTGEPGHPCSDPSLPSPWPAPLGT